MAKKLKYYVYFRLEKEGGYTAIVPNIPSCITYGQTIEEVEKKVTKNVKEYIKEYKKVEEEMGDEVQDDGDSFVKEMEF